MKRKPKPRIAITDPEFVHDALEHCPRFLTLDDALDFVRRVRIDGALKAAA